jgi:hypothetical protein
LDIDWSVPEEAVWGVAFLDEDGMPDILFSDTEDSGDVEREFSESFPGCELIGVDATMEGTVGNIVQHAKMLGARMLVSHAKLDEIQGATDKEHKAAGRKLHHVEFEQGGRKGSMQMWAKSASQAKLYAHSRLGRSATSMFNGERMYSRGAIGAAQRFDPRNGLGLMLGSKNDHRIHGGVRITSAREVGKTEAIAKRPFRDTRAST